MDFINKPLGWILSNIASVKIFDHSFAAAVFVFTLLINLALIPLNIKSQKSSVQQTRIKPKLDDLKKRCGDDRQKYSLAMQDLYKDEGVSMSGGCLPMILRLVLMMCIYTLILSPLTYMAGVDKTSINAVSTAIDTKMNELKSSDTDEYNEYIKALNWQAKGRHELSIINIVRGDISILEEFLGDDFAEIEDELLDIKEKDNDSKIDYTFISDKINLTEKPNFSFDVFGSFKPIWFMPILAFAAQMLSSILSMKMQKKINPDAPSMAGMMLTMPLISLFIGFTLPGGVAFYWACSSFISGFIQVGMQYFYGPYKMLANERAKELVKQCDFEAKQIKKLSDPVTQED